jgi:hypothetical protein
LGTPYIYETEFNLKKERIQVLVGKPEGKGQLRKPRLRWEDNIKMYFQEVECGFVD